MFVQDGDTMHRVLSDTPDSEVCTLGEQSEINNFIDRKFENTSPHEKFGKLIKSSGAIQ